MHSYNPFELFSKQWALVTRSKPQAFPVDENGDWQAHWMFVGEVLDIQENFSAAE